MIYLVIDAVVAGCISVFVLRGIKMGLVMSVASALTLVLSLFGALFIVDNIAEPAAGIIRPFTDGWTQMNGADSIVIPENADPGAVEDALAEGVRSLGFGENNSRKIAGAINTAIHTTGATIREALAQSLSLSIARGFLFVISFSALLLIIHHTASLLHTLASIPIINWLNKLGGLIGGTAVGCVIVYIGVRVISVFGVIPPGLAERTRLLSLFYR
ncbi:MAG: CvpA family protein [Oscillospiraceae bacterium]|nr:CvpA family protein [Oscillospiraceae bacterium]